MSARATANTLSAPAKSRSTCRTRPPSASHHHATARHCSATCAARRGWPSSRDRKSTRLNSSHLVISYAVFCLKKKKNHNDNQPCQDFPDVHRLLQASHFHYSHHLPSALRRPAAVAALSARRA